jgi:uncharacterized protein with von Willebrand factor type A (vWA) domain
MYPFASLPENLTAFGAALRRDYGFHVGPRQIADAARALQVTSIGDERTVRDTLRPILSSTVDHVMVFDRAFDAFFHPEVSSPQASRRPPERADEGAAVPPAHRAAAPGGAAGEDGPSSEQARVAAGAPIDMTDAEREDEGALLRSSYSAVAAEGEPPVLGPVDRWWHDAAWAFVKKVQTALSRRWRPALRGPRFDLRRTLRSSLHTGGEPVLPRWQARPRLRPRFVVIVDGSRSMAPHAQPALEAAVALASVTPHVEAFVFSTELKRITRDVRRAVSGERRRPPELHHAWGGGTGIGACLRDLIHRHGERVLGRDTVIIIASDGLDVGHPDLLRQSMSELHRRSAAVIWLNPLIDTPGYEPTALGMQTARPSVSTFAWVPDANGLGRLARLVRVRS